MNLKSHFREIRNKRRVHIEQLVNILNNRNTDSATRRRIRNKLKHERRQLAVIDDIWDVN